jgi:ubiquinone biosynthesis accessory factor UbiK
MRYNQKSSIGAAPDMKANFLKSLAEQLSNALPQHVGTLKKDFEKNCQAILKKTFAQFDLVTREEFDAQTKVLLRTRKKLEEIEKAMEKLALRKKK